LSKKFFFIPTEKILDVLRDLDIEILVPCHCTGEVAVDAALGDIVKAGYAGLRI
jgi:metal-dependent hydrolase (beta-lactamase superfamily II)